MRIDIKKTGGSNVQISMNIDNEITQARIENLVGIYSRKYGGDYTVLDI